MTTSTTDFFFNPYRAQFGSLYQENGKCQENVTKLSLNCLLRRRAGFDTVPSSTV